MANSQKLLVKEDKTVQMNARIRVGTITFCLPFVSAMYPQRCALETMPTIC